MILQMHVTHPARAVGLMVAAWWLWWRRRDDGVMTPV
jgi:hypothetical protein